MWILEQVGEISQVEGSDIQAIRIGSRSETRPNDRLPQQCPLEKCCLLRLNSSLKGIILNEVGVVTFAADDGGLEVYPTNVRNTLCLKS